MKNQFFEDRVRVNGDAYYYDYKNEQIFSILPNAFPLPPIIAVSNAAKSRIYGVELESEWLVTSADHLDVNVNYNHARFVSFDWISLLYGKPPTFSIDRSDTPLPQAPLWNGAIGYQHVLRFANAGSLSFGGQMRFYSGADSALEPVTDEYQPAYHIGDARLMYTGEKGIWSFWAFANNIGNVPIRGNTVHLPPTGPVIQIGPPRVYGIAVAARY